MRRSIVGLHLEKEWQFNKPIRAIAKNCGICGQMFISGKGIQLWCGFCELGTCSLYSRNQIATNDPSESLIRAGLLG